MSISHYLNCISIIVYSIKPCIMNCQYNIMIFICFKDDIPNKLIWDAMLFPCKRGNLVSCMCKFPFCARMFVLKRG